MSQYCSLKWGLQKYRSPFSPLFSPLSCLPLSLSLSLSRSSGDLHALLFPFHCGGAAGRSSSLSGNSVRRSGGPSSDGARRGGHIRSGLARFGLGRWQRLVGSPLSPQLASAKSHLLSSSAPVVQGDDDERRRGLYPLLGGAFHPLLRPVALLPWPSWAIQTNP